jgi:uncharacterized protein
MEFTNPYVGTVRRKLSDSELAQAIRLDIAAELDAINLYQTHIESTDNDTARRMIQHIMDEEKQHMEEFTQILYMLDRRQAEFVRVGQREFAEEAGGTPFGLAPEGRQDKAA